VKGIAVTNAVEKAALLLERSPALSWLTRRGIFGMLVVLMTPAARAQPGLCDSCGGLPECSGLCCATGENCYPYTDLCPGGTGCWCNQAFVCCCDYYDVSFGDYCMCSGI
jgi:hypothetical protein